MHRRVTITDVAQLAGVSRQTVSRAINRKGEISPTTLQRVLQAVQALGYQPSQVARGLATRRTRTVGLVVPDITNPFFPEIARGVQDVARSQGYNVFLCNSDESPEQELQVLRSLAAQMVDGIVLCGSRISADQLIAFAESYWPLVVLNRELECPGVGLIAVDNQRGMQLAVDHLVGRGHRCIALLAGPVTSPSSQRRVQGYRRAMQGWNLPVAPDWVVPCPPTVEGGQTEATSLLARHPEVTALIAYNDLVAIGACLACEALGRAVPASCAVIGFDDIRLAAMVRPTLTTIRVDKYELGRAAMQRLLTMLDQPETAIPPQVVDVELVIRESAP